ncbi:hypothetical protein LZ30DRAFT_310066 [Colletotrichum cereale]|nr:hypothetical protein LZ30DRAFT_310066 [Colletotrichum cereale]
MAQLVPCCRAATIQLHAAPVLARLPYGVFVLCDTLHHISPHRADDGLEPPWFLRPSPRLFPPVSYAAIEGFFAARTSTPEVRGCAGLGWMLRKRKQKKGKEPWDLPLAHPGRDGDGYSMFARYMLDDFISSGVWVGSTRWRDARPRGLELPEADIMTNYHGRNYPWLCRIVSIGRPRGKTDTSAPSGTLALDISKDEASAHTARMCNCDENKTSATCSQQAAAQSNNMLVVRLGLDGEANGTARLPPVRTPHPPMHRAPRCVACCREPARSFWLHHNQIVQSSSQSRTGNRHFERKRKEEKKDENKRTQWKHPLRTRTRRLVSASEIKVDVHRPQETFSTARARTGVASSVS